MIHQHANLCSLWERKTRDDTANHRVNTLAYQQKLRNRKPKGEPNTEQMVRLLSLFISRQRMDASASLASSISTGQIGDGAEKHSVPFTIVPGKTPSHCACNISLIVARADEHAT